MEMKMDNSNNEGKRSKMNIILNETDPVSKSVL
jgi:hypothetical protein